MFHLYRSINVNATVQLAKWAAEVGVRFVYFIGIKAGEGATVGKCAADENQGDTEGIYGQTKRAGEVKL